MQQIQQMKHIKLNLVMEALNLEYFNFKPIKLCNICFIPNLKNGMRFHPEPYSFSPPKKKRMNDIILSDLLNKIETLTIL